MEINDILRILGEYVPAAISAACAVITVCQQKKLAEDKQEILNAKNDIYQLAMRDNNGTINNGPTTNIGTQIINDEVAINQISKVVAQKIVSDRLLQYTKDGHAPTYIQHPDGTKETPHAFLFERK